MVNIEYFVSVDNTELSSNLHKGRHSSVNLLGGVGRADLDPDPGLAPGHHREAQAYHEYSLLQHQTGELCVELLVHQHDGADGMVLSSDGEASRGHGPPEPHRVLTDLFHQGVVGHELASRNNRMTRWKVFRFILTMSNTLLAVPTTGGGRELEKEYGLDLCLSRDISSPLPVV